MDIIFVHIPKTAGNSILKTYQNVPLQHIGHDLKNPNYISYSNYYESNYNKTNILRKLFLKKKKAFSFAVTRNTWSRVFSAYQYLSKGGMTELDKDDFKEFIEPYKDFNDFVKNGLKNCFRKQIHFIPQEFWIERNNKNYVDKILHYENLNEEVKSLMTGLGYDPLELEVLNKSNDLNYKDYYTPETIEIVREIYQNEIQLFDFAY